MIGDIVSAFLGYKGAQETNESRERIAAEANAFSAQQFATRYQTTVKDMQAAGLSPMLAYGQGGGSPPTGQQANIENPTSSAIEAYQKSRQRDLISAQIQNTNEDTAVKESQVAINKKQAELIAQQVQESKSRERQSDTSATESLVRAHSQIEYGNKTQKQLGDMYWSQMKVNQQTLPKIVSEIVSNGAYAAQARALAFKAIQDGNLSKADLTRALNEKAFEESAAGRSKRFIEYGINSAGKLTEIVKPFKGSTTRETGTSYDRQGNPSGGYSRERYSR